jgi:hypothetical protein
MHATYLQWRHVVQNVHVNILRLESGERDSQQYAV